MKEAYRRDNAHQTQEENENQLEGRNALTEALRSGNLCRLPDARVRIPESKFFISDSIISSLV